MDQDKRQQCVLKLFFYLILFLILISVFQIIFVIIIFYFVFSEKANLVSLLKQAGIIDCIKSLIPENKMEEYEKVIERLKQAQEKKKRKKYQYPGTTQKTDTVKKKELEQIFVYKETKTPKQQEAPKKTEKKQDEKKASLDSTKYHVETKSIWDDYESVIDIMKKKRD